MHTQGTFGLYIGGLPPVAGGLLQNKDRICDVKLHINVNLCFKKTTVLNTLESDNDIGCRNLQKLAYHMFTCEFHISYITMSALLS